MGVINHKAMQLFKLDNNVSDPNGGKYGRDENNQLNGYLEERAFIDFAGKSSTSGDLKKQLIEALGIYAWYYYCSRRLHEKRRICTTRFISKRK